MVRLRDNFPRTWVSKMLLLLGQSISQGMAPRFVEALRNTEPSDSLKEMVGQETRAAKELLAQNRALLEETFDEPDKQEREMSRAEPKNV